jgi:hypothetical protein
MKLLEPILFTFFILTATASAAKIEMPLGGKLPVDTKVWEVESLKKVPGSQGMIFIHKKFKDLKGLVFDGTIKDKGLCDESSTKKSWLTCERKIAVGKDYSFQILSQRMIGPKVYQTYILSFNYPMGNDPVFAPELLKLKKFIEVHHE